MKIAVQTTAFPGAPYGAYVTVDVQPDTTFREIKTKLETQLRIPADRYTLAYKGENIPDGAKINEVGVEDQDMMACQISSGNPFAQSRLVANSPYPQRTERRDNRAAKLNMQRALEATPEAFADVTMLYVDAEVNGIPLKAFVDSGAQKTVMSKECARKVKLLDIVDTDFAGVAMGVGAARIMGRVHIMPMKIGDEVYAASAIVLEQSQNIDLLIGLDMLKKYRCNIDLGNNVLYFGTTEKSVPFLPESQLPAHAKLTKQF